MTTMTADGVRDELVRRLSAMSARGVVVESVDVTDDYWPGDDRSIQIVAHLSEPRGDTWEVDDIIDLRRQMNEILADMDLLPFVRTILTGGQPVEDEAGPGDDTEGLTATSTRGDSLPRPAGRCRQDEAGLAGIC